MQGVTVISSEVIKEIPLTTSGIIAFLLFIVSSIVISISFIGVIERVPPRKLFISALCVGILLFVVTFIFLLSGDTIEYTQYKVIIDDTVNMQEFLNTYEIVDTIDTNMFIVIEKTT